MGMLSSQALCAGVNSPGLGVSSLMTEPSERSGERIGREGSPSPARATDRRASS